MWELGRTIVPHEEKLQRMIPAAAAGDSIRDIAIALVDVVANPICLVLTRLV